MAGTKGSARQDRALAEARTDFIGALEPLGVLARRHGIPVRDLRERAAAEDWLGERAAWARAQVVREERELADLREAARGDADALVHTLSDPGVTLSAVRRAAERARTSAGRLYCATQLLGDAQQHLRAAGAAAGA